MSAVPRSLAILSSASAGGAGIAARRLARAMRDHGELETDFLDSVSLGGVLPPDVARQTSYSNHAISDTHFTYEYPGYARGWLIEMLAGYDVLNIHWAAYLLSLGELDALTRRGQPVFFTLHDFHYLTGGCHYPAACTGFEAGCHNCPQVDRARIAPPRIARNHAIKREIFARPNVHLIAPSAWLRDRAVGAGIVPRARAHVLRNPYAPRQAPLLHRKRDPLRILLIADSLHEGRKQMPLALEALAHLVAARRKAGAPVALKVDLVGKSDAPLLERLAKSGVPHTAHGRLTDPDRLAEIFARTDLLLTCSNEDNWPNILVEAGAFGAVPVVGPGHGCAEFVQRYNFGQIATGYTPEAFAEAMTRAIERWSAAECERALEKIRADHSPQTIARDMQALLGSALSAADPRPASLFPVLPLPAAPQPETVA